MLVKEWTLAGSVIFVKLHAMPAKRESRSRKPKEKPSPFRVIEANHRNMVRKVQRLICANFGPGDGFMSLTSDDDHLPKNRADAQRMANNFIARLRRWYRKHGQELRYIYSIEQGKSGRLHIHIIMNGGPTSLELRKIWGMGDANRKDLYESGDYRQLSSYIVKETVETDREERRKFKRAFVPSKNLVDPKPVRDAGRPRDFTDPIPHEGFYIDKDSIYDGVNPITGRMFKAWVELPLLPEPHAPPDRDPIPKILRTASSYFRKRKHDPIPDGTERWIRTHLKGGVQYEFDIDALTLGAFA
jgi:hypothetical protein